MSGSLKPSEVLAKAADLIEPEGRWTQRALGRRENGGPNGIAEGTVCWCMEGSVAQVSGEYGGEPYQTAYTYVEAAIERRSAAAWNDDPDRTQAEVVAALRKASELAKAEGQ